MVVDLSTYTSKPEENDPQIRVLFCRTCKTFDELPDYEGRPSDDLLLNLTVDKHQRPEPHIGILFKFPLKYWSVPKVQQEIVKQITGGSEGLDVFGTNFYNIRMSFAEDAMTCWGQHNRPKGQCPDYKSDKKQLKPDTAAERKDAGLDKPGTTGPKVYLCDFCPGKMYNQKRAYTEKGLYN
jgi:hypothetical protein